VCVCAVCMRHLWVSFVCEFVCVCVCGCLCVGVWLCVCVCVCAFFVWPSVLFLAFLSRPTL
jgi:hypothetical protein